MCQKSGLTGLFLRLGSPKLVPRPTTLNPKDRMPSKTTKPKPTPTNFGNRLKEMLADRNMNAFQLHEATGINHSIISRLLSGSQSWVSGKMLGTIAAALTEDPIQQAGLIAAKLADERKVSALPDAEALIKVTVAGKIPTELGKLNQVPKQLEAPVKFILDRARKDPSVEQVLIQFAEALKSRG